MKIFFNALVCTQHKNTSTKYIPELLQDAPASELVAKLNSLDAADEKHLFFCCVCFAHPLNWKRNREEKVAAQCIPKKSHTLSELEPVS